MAGPIASIYAGNILKALALRAGSVLKTNKFAIGTTGALSLGVPKVMDILGGDSELEEYVDSQLAEGMTTTDITEVKKSINFMASMFDEGVWVQPLKEGQVHRYLIVDFLADQSQLVVSRNTKAHWDKAYKAGQDSQLARNNKRRQTNRRS